MQMQSATRRLGKRPSLKQWILTLAMSPAMCLGMWLASITANAPVAQGQSREAGEYEVKAAFLYNFAKFVDWPAGAFRGADDAMTFCVYGEDPFGGALDRIIEKKTINDRPLRLARPTQVSDLRACHILFLSASEVKRLPQILGSLRGIPVLTVGDTQHFIQMNGMIGLLIEDNKVRFEINVKATKESGLRTSSKILALAKTVSGAKETGN